MSDTSLWLGGKEFKSRLIVGTGKYPSFENMREAIEASGAEMVTVAVRRVSLPGQGEIAARLHRHRALHPAAEHRRLLQRRRGGAHVLSRARGRARLARQARGDRRLAHAVPRREGLLEATRTLAREGFTVLPYTNDDPVIAKKLEDAGAAAVMPLGAPIGSGLGIRNPYNIKLILEAVTVPVIVDAGVGHGVGRRHRHGARLRRRAHEHGDRRRKDPVAMATAMKLAVEAGRLASRRAHRQEALRHRVVAARGRAGVDQLVPSLWLVTDRRLLSRPGPMGSPSRCLGRRRRHVCRWRLHASSTPSRNVWPPGSGPSSSARRTSRSATSCRSPRSS